MSYSIEQQAGQRIIVGYLGSDFDLAHEAPEYIKTLRDILDTMDGPCVYISDVHNYEINFGELTSALGLATRGDITVLSHPQLHKTIVVSTNSLIRLGVNALGQQQYGTLRASVAATLEDALEEAARDLAMLAQHS